MPPIITSLAARMHTSIPDRYRDEFDTERLRKNISREITLSCILPVIALALILKDISLLKSLDIYKIILGIHIALLLIPILFLSGNYLVRTLSAANEGFLTTLHISINIIVLVLCAVLTVLSKISGYPPFAYLAALFSIASMVILTPLESLIIFCLSLFVNIAGIFIIQVNTGGGLDEVFYTAILLMMALIIAKSNYSAFAREYINKKALLEKSLELDEMNRITKGILEKRTAELNNKIEYEKLRTNFFANISHELRTPLAVIFSAEQMMRFLLNGSNGNEKQREISQYAVIIRQNCYRLIRLISNLIDTTKLDAGYLKPNFSNGNIVKIVEDITLSVAKYIEDRGLSLIFDTESEEIFVASDPDLIERIMLNLLSNAVKFTPKGGNIWVNVYDKPDKVYISVRDTGIGIPECMKQLIFEKFVQVDKTSTRTREGSGIGLSLVRSLVQLHDGSISMVSEEGTGSEFTVGIPKRTLPDDEIIKEDTVIGKTNIEKISIEFSDIYN